MKNEYLNSGRTKQKLKTRMKILDCARDLLKEGKEITLESIAEEVGISRATIYRYYSNVEILLGEAGIDVQSPQEIFRQVGDLEFREQLLGIQDYFNQLSTRYEPGFRKYLGVLLSTGAPSDRRGARRVATLQQSFQSQNLELSEEEREYLLVSATVLMGIEPLIVTKDVCNLDNEKSLKVLRWALEMILLGCQGRKTTPNKI